MKAKPIEFQQDKFSRIIQQLKQWKAHKSKLGLKEKPRMALEQSRKTKKKTQETFSFATFFHNNFQLKVQN